ncbi:M20 family metallopeptidase [Sporosarcina aquimarina]|uniref:M20 metallopeptidase family protein n=1 Tax=Sporosarcina aquimarina TaxID=114975 RepID=UPI00204044E2|nr:M20 family metallopeptidase [Sporosarcina aquimarina]MCM3758556.1 M20 family metallopeptidase [Sporosarcina aquimarina]
MTSTVENMKRYEEQIIHDRRYLHQNPELGFDLPNTQRFIQQRLDEIGIDHKPCGKVPDEVRKKYARAGFAEQANCTGVIATIGSGSPCILLRADMDALPIEEEVESEFKSTKPGLMHACGHDSHVAMLLGAAQILKDQEAELQGTVKLFFQPGEEWGYGSKLMIDDGALENPKVDAAFGIHIMPDQEAGTLSVTKGTITQAMDSYIVDIKGYGGHSSQPHKTIDANMIMNQLYTSLNLLMTRESDPKQNVTFSVGSMSGGTVTNVIPERAVLSGNMRSFDQATRDHLCERIPEMIDHVVKAWRGEYTITEFHTPTTYNDPTFVDQISDSLETVMGSENMVDLGAINGSEDFSYISQNVPSAFVILGTGKEGEAPVHNPKMIQDEDIFKYGAALHAQVAMDWLKGQS